MCQTNELRLLGKEANKVIVHYFQKINLATVSGREIRMEQK